MAGLGRYGPRKPPPDSTHAPSHRTVPESFQNSSRLGEAETRTRGTEKSPSAYGETFRLEMLGPLSDAEG